MFHSTRKVRTCCTIYENYSRFAYTFLDGKQWIVHWLGAVRKEGEEDIKVVLDVTVVISAKYAVQWRGFVVAVLNIVVL
jgi:hypothetical protein